MVIDSSFLVTSLSIVGLLVLSAFFSGSETALTGASKAKLTGLKGKGSKMAERALELKENNGSLLGALLLGNNLVNILATSLATSILTTTFKESGVLIATFVMTLLILIFAEIMPKTYAITNPEGVSIKVAAPVKFFVLAFTPFVKAIRLFVRITFNIFGIRSDDNLKDMAAEEIAGAISLHHSEGTVQKEARDILLGALDLGNREVEEIMLHRSQIEMISTQSSPKEIFEKCLNSPYTRLPIYKESPENVIGVLHAKDLLRSLKKLNSGQTVKNFNVNNLKILDVAMKPYFVPETTTLDQQMKQFLKRKSHFALVVDEYGALRGLITLEDILEEIVGQIRDEHDINEQTVKELSDNSIVVEGNMTIRDLNRHRDWNIPDEEANTVAGLVIHEAQSIPYEKQIFIFSGFRYEILKRKGNRITKIKIKKLDG
ncbi:HlyC/CorC family transporter [Paracoccaceae bacterium]|nr:HlyC/CorC family transporter [Paracoccaceae bacterium]